MCFPRWLFVFPLLAGLPAAVKGQSPYVAFSPALAAVPMWRRRWSFSETFALLANSLHFIYIPTDALLTMDGQYEGGILGSFGGVLQTLIDFFVGCAVLRWVTLPALGRAEMRTPPGMKIPDDEMQRSNIMKYVFYAYLFSCVPILAGRAILQPESLDLHFDFDSLTNSSAPLMDCGNPCRSFSRAASFELAIIYSLPTYLLWRFQKSVYRALTAPFSAAGGRRVHRGADGG